MNRILIGNEIPGMELNGQFLVIQIPFSFLRSPLGFDLEYIYFY